MSTAACDHVVWFVNDLDRASAACEGAGFRVTPGGTHAGGLTSNALIGFADGTYVELLRVNLERPFALARRLRDVRAASWALQGRSALDRRFLPAAGDGPGVRDLALGVDDISAVVTRLRAAGVPMDDPQPGERIRTDGRRVAWRLGMPRERWLPFLIEDVTPRALRVPGGDAVRHPNGATGIARLTVRGPASDRLERYLETLVGAPGRDRGRLSFSLSNAELVLPRDRLERVVIAPQFAGREGPLELPVATGEDGG